MNGWEMNRWLSVCWVLVGFVWMGESVLAGQKRVAILGDSITYDGRWATRVESALRATPDFQEAEIVNFGLPSETLSGLSEPGHAGGQFPRPCLFERLDRVLDAFRPDLVLACYGMNDGIMEPLDQARMEAFRQGATRLKDECGKRKAELVFITAPLYSADKPESDSKHYDAVLDAQADWLVSQLKDGWQVIDIRPTLKAAVSQAKVADPKFVYAADQVHPGDSGHQFIAAAVVEPLWAILKLPGKPAVAAEEALKILKQRADLLKLAWLTKTGHKRPGIPAGLPLDQAGAKAAQLLLQFQMHTANLPSLLKEAKTSDWNGYERIDFKISGRAGLLVKPKSPAPGKPWIWRTEFFGHEPQADLSLLDKGFHVAYIDVQNLYGAPVALEAMGELFLALTTEEGLSKKPVLEGFSRGGLFAFNWAAAHPGNTAALYVDAPVCDFKSWPGGKGKGPGSKPDWERLLKVYGFTEEQALAYDQNPVDNLAPIAKAGVPILAVIGQADEVVPVEENIDLVEQRYKALGGNIEVIRKPGCKHHPHSLKDPQPIVDFILKAVSGK